MASHLDSLSTSEVCTLLKTNGFDDDVVEVFRANKIDGSTLKELNSEDLKELGIIALGDRKRLERVKKADGSVVTASPSLKADISTPNRKASLIHVAG